jgi:hypothetical protein
MLINEYKLRLSTRQQTAIDAAIWQWEREVT